MQAIHTPQLDLTYPFILCVQRRSARSPTRVGMHRSRPRQRQRSLPEGDVPLHHGRPAQVNGRGVGIDSQGSSSAQGQRMDAMASG